MQTVYLVWSCPVDDPDIDPEVIAIYNDAQAASLHAGHAAAEMARILDLSGDAYRNAASAWDFEYAGVCKVIRRYVVQAKDVYAHPDQWQESRSA